MRPSPLRAFASSLLIAAAACGGTDGDTGAPAGGSESTNDDAAASPSPTTTLDGGGGGDGRGDGPTAPDAGGSTPPGAIAPTFFGVGMNALGSPWPPSTPAGPAPAKALRLWDSGVHWSQLETCDAAKSAGAAADDPANPCYTWKNLDTWMAHAKSQGMDVIYTFGAVPDFATAQPTPPPTCAHYNTYSCLPPVDVAADGTGSDATWLAFVGALSKHYRGQIAFYELWNEPDTTLFFDGTIAQFGRMMKDAHDTIRANDPAARILSPSFHGPTAATWFTKYLANGGAAWFDIVNFHGRAQGAANAQPEGFLGVHQEAMAVLQANALTGRPFWDDEAGWLKDQVLDPDEQAAYVARAYVLRAGAGIERFYWYQWDSPGQYGLQGAPSGGAYAEVAQWIVGGKLSPCASAGSRWTCDLTRANGGAAAIAWDTSQTCDKGACSTSPATVDARYAHYRDLSGADAAIADHSVPLGAKPLLLEP